MGLLNTLGLDIYKFPSFSNARTLSIGTPFIVANEVSGSNNFNGFPTLCYDSKGNYFCVYQFQSGHSAVAPSGSGLYYKKSTDKGLTWSAPKYLWNGSTPIYPNFAIPGYGIGYNDRHFMFCYDTSAGGRTPYVMYSDDEGTTWSARIKMSNDYDGAGQQFDMTSRSFMYNGKLYIPGYGKTSGTLRNAMLYESADNGLTWTKTANISSIGGTQDYEEPHVLLTQGNYWLCAMRSDPNGRVDVSIGFSLTDWWTKQQGLITGFNSIGKPSIAISRNGTIAITGRRSSDQKAIWGYSTDGGKSFNENLIAGVPNDYQTYGDLIWDNENNRFLMVWSNDAAYPNGPAIIYGAFLTES